MPLTQADLDNRFNYHRPDDKKVSQHESVRAGCKQVAIMIDDLVPDGREKSLALTHLEEVMMWANAGIARN